MPRQFTAEELIQAVRDRGGFNDADTEGTQDQDILLRLNDEASTTIYNLVIQAHREFYVVSELVPLVSTTVRYRIPARAMYQKLRDLFYVNGTMRFPLQQISRESLGRYWTSGFASCPSAFYLEGNSIVLVPDLNASYTGSLEVSYYFRPGDLVLSTDCRLITGVNTSSKQLTVESNPPSTWDSSGEKLDVHSGKSGAEIHAWDLTTSSISGNVITLAEAIDGSVYGTIPAGIGDYVCLANTAALPGIPREMHPVLADAATVNLLQVKDPEAYGVSKQALDAQLQKIMHVISYRVEGRPDAVVNRDSFLFGGSGYRGRR